MYSNLRQASSNELLNGAVSILSPDPVDFSSVGLVDPGGLERRKGGESGLDGLEDLLFGVEDLEREGV